MEQVVTDFVLMCNVCYRDDSLWGVLQEPGNSEEIVCFARSKNAKFDMFEKIDVNGSNAHPLWKYLKHKQGGTLGE
jgi:hypothetical protein